MSIGIFAPQRRALFRHLNFPKWPNLVCLYILTWKCASRHNGVHFFDISTSKSGPNVVCFVHFDLGMCFAPQRRAIFHLSSGQLALFDPPEPQIVGKTQCFATFLPFSRICIFFLLTLSLLLFSLLIFLFSLTLSLLFICPYCRKFDF